MSNLTLAKVTQVQKKSCCWKNNSIKTNENEIPAIMNNPLVSEFVDYKVFKRSNNCFQLTTSVTFDFETVIVKDVKKEILNVNIKESSTVAQFQQLHDSSNNFKTILRYLSIFRI